MPHRGTSNRIVVSVDDSEDSAAAVAWVLTHVVRPQDRLHLLHIAPDKQAIYSDTYLPPPAPGKEALEAHAKAFCAQRFLPLLERHNVEHDVEVLTADGNAESIGQAICNRAQQLQAKLLALAPHTKGTLRRILVGSVTDYCLRHSASPVLIVKAEGTGGSEKKEL